jgi:cysteine-S-conjugate beta-lyase
LQVYNQSSESRKTFEEIPVTYNFDQIVPRRETNSLKWLKYPEDVLPFWVADMDFPAPPPILAALHQAVEHGVFGYDIATTKLKEAVASRMDKLYGWKVDPEAVVATPGLVSAFNAAAVMLCRPGEGYLIQPPVYMPFNHLQQNHGFVRQEAPLVYQVENGKIHYEIDWETFEKGFNSLGSRTRMFLLCNPHNPNGQIYSQSELKRMAEICLKNEVVIVSDEIHSELLLGKSQFIPIASLSPEIAHQTITLIAPSKTFNIPGLFCGFAIIPNPALREEFDKTLEQMTLHVNGLGIIGAQAAFSGACDDWLLDLRKFLTHNRDVIVDYVDENLPGLCTTVPAATYLAWFDCKDLGTKDPYKFFLNKAKVALNDGAAFGTGGQGFVRFNFGTSESQVLAGLERMKNALEHHEPE